MPRAAIQSTAGSIARAPKKASRIFTSNPMTWWNAQFASWKAASSAIASSIAFGSHRGIAEPRALPGTRSVSRVPGLPRRPRTRGRPGYRLVASRHDPSPTP